MDTKLDIQDLRFIMKLEQLGSLAALAREENVTPPAITKRLNLLEDKVKTRLVIRTTRRMQLTHEGYLLAERAFNVLEEMRRIEDELCMRNEVAAGKLKIHGSLGFGRTYLAQLVAQFHTRHPQIDVQLFLSDNPLAPQQNPHGRDAFDIQISIGDIPNSRWVAHPVARNRRILCASPRYLASAPPLRTPADLGQHACLILRENDDDASLWRFSKSGARKHDRSNQKIRVNATMESNDGDVIRQWCEAGKGVMVRSEWSVASSLANGILVEVLPHYRLPDADILALVPQSRVASMRTKLFIAELREAFHPDPPWRSHAPTG